MTESSIVYHRNASAHPRLYVEGATIYRSTAAPSVHDSPAHDHARRHQP
jgi:hypothetical protein